MTKQADSLLRYCVFIIGFLLLAVVSHAEDDTQTALTAHPTTAPSSADLASKSVTPPNHKTIQPSQLAYHAEYEAEYRGGWIPIKVSASRELEALENGQWRSAFAVYSSIMDLSEISVMALNDEGFVPDYYEYKTSGFASKEKRKQVFHWQAQKVWGDHKDRFWDYALEPGTQDSMSYQEQLRYDLIAGKETLAYPVVYKHKLKVYEFERIGEDILNTPHGPLKTLVVKQKINDHNELNSRIWFAADFNFILVKLKQERPNGDEQIITLKQARQGDAVLNAYTD